MSGLGPQSGRSTHRTGGDRRGVAIKQSGLGASTGWARPRGQLLTTLLPHLGQVMDTPHTHTPSPQCLLTWPWAGCLLRSLPLQRCGPPGSRDFWLQSLWTAKESLRTPPASSLKGVKLNRQTISLLPRTPTLGIWKRKWDSRHETCQAVRKHLWNPNKRCNQSSGPAAAEVCLKSRVIFQSEQDPVLPPDPGPLQGCLWPTRLRKYLKLQRGHWSCPGWGVMPSLQVSLAALPSGSQTTALVCWTL